MEYLFEGLLIKLEHEMIQAQTMAAYFASLGGGFFLCRHLKTALVMARQQQRMAAILGDTSMFLKCLVNQAYDLIYAGSFQAANVVIKEVLQHARTMTPIDDSLIQMCRSARLFSKRVAKARQLPAESKSQMTNDDLYRIRMVQDQSVAATSSDVLAPFRRG